MYNKDEAVELNPQISDNANKRYLEETQVERASSETYTTPSGKTFTHTGAGLTRIEYVTEDMILTEVSWYLSGGGCNLYVDGVNFVNLVNSPVSDSGNIKVPSWFLREGTEIKTIRNGLNTVVISLIGYAV